MKRIAIYLPALSIALFAVVVAAKLPPPSEEAKAKTAQTAAKKAHTDKADAYKLCRSMEKVATDYHAAAKKSGKKTAAPIPTPPCTDPGPFVAASTDPKPPIEAAGAHSPPKTATAPPSTTTPHAEQPEAKK